MTTPVPVSGAWPAVTGGLFFWGLYFGVGCFMLAHAFVRGFGEAS